ncbi:MAG: hypothetical protein A3D75_02415 [Candidatus Levybacteria bacterium RIFCSPHIGHO2_02_FULL_37_18]|nr:MAG: hypothetical protein A2770_04790 [Candidatus Levybacteria bacterium RIFCSPHIGHO2_01_FULL_38_12]OGH21573.1 MAG: hypothetical protein A3D75_02415 [Candidatus Levybacteria bacterium RIFCSPHIGHO2_02_FULL_37_18]OGH34738.1 MAG: hypothetical protein A3A47_01095 [Candidatus Levybacteria bacterium RIFCSPLOWO2_01_FULL_37_20]OGH43585.1 MAG: hypothetical protein A3J14_03330 [Candidatus Levybacteria bacterium RIFCSPLOWO2_02_FULL_37_18]
MDNTMLRVLGIRSFFALWLAEVFSQIAMNMANFILIILAFKFTSSNTAVSGVVIAFTMPAILFGLLAGVYVDRWNKKTVLNLTNLMRAGILILILLFPHNLFVLYLVTFVMSIVTQFFIPAETPMIPQIVPKELLLSANALFGMGIYGSMLIAYALSGPSLLFFGETHIFVFLAVLFVIASFFVSFIRVSKQKGMPVSLSPTLMEEVKGALSLVTKTKRISHSLFLLTLSSLLILTFAVIGPGYAKQILDISVEEFPLMFVAPAAMGMVFGAVFLSNIKKQSFKEKSVLYGIFLSSIGLFLLPFCSKAATKGLFQELNNILPAFLSINIFHIVILLAFLLGIANAFVFVPSNTILQEETSDEFRGKIYGFLNSLIGAVSLLPIIVVGGLADVFGVAKVLIGISISLVIIGMYFLATQ